MTRGVKVRLLAFLVLSAVGVVYVAGSFLGLVDRVLGRGFTIHATLPTSGGLFEGSEVTYRGVKVGKVSGMDVTRTGLRARPGAARTSTKIPDGLQDVRPQPLGRGRAVPRLRAARPARAAVRRAGRHHQGQRGKPADERGGAAHPDGRHGRLGRRRRAVHGRRRARQHVPRHRQPAAADGRLRAPSSSTRPTPTSREHDQRCSTPGRPCCGPRPTHEQDIPRFAQGLADLTGTLRTSDQDLRTILQGGPGTVKEVDSLLRGSRAHACRCSCPT